MNQKRSILFLTRLYHPHIGGVEKHLSEISKILIAKGYEVTIITEQFDKKNRQHEIVEGVRVFRIPIAKNDRLKKFLIWKWVLLHHRLFYAPTVIHIHDVFYWILPFWPFLCGKKIFITFHGYEGYPLRKSWIIQRKIAERLSKGSICVGRFMKKWYFTFPSSVIYGGVRLVKENYPQKKDTALFFGRLDDQTGITEYLHAFDLIRAKIPNFRLTIVGEGPIKIKKRPGLTLHPFKTDLSKHISENEYIFISRYLSFLEALSFGKKVVATYDNPIKYDYLTLSPFKKFIEIGMSGKEIAGIVLGAQKNPAPFNKKANDGRVWAKSQTWEKVVSVYLKLWGLPEKVVAQ